VSKYRISIPEGGCLRYVNASVGIRLEYHTGRSDEDRADAWPREILTDDPEKVAVARAAGLTVTERVRTDDDPEYEFDAS